MTYGNAMAHAAERAESLGHVLNQPGETSPTKWLTTCQGCGAMVLVEKTIGTRGWTVSGSTQRRSCLSIQKSKAHRTAQRETQRRKL